VKTAHADGVAIEEREPVWLVMEWRSDDDPTPKFYLTTLPRRMSHKQLVRIIKERWRTERMYEDLKGELGLDHFEGRSFVGLASSCLGRALLLRLCRCRTDARFSPLVPKAGFRRFARGRGLNGTLQTPSSRCGSRLREPSCDGYPAARAAMSHPR